VTDPTDRDAEGWEAISGDGSGTLAPNEELERAMREAADAVEARETAGKARAVEGGSEAGTLEDELVAVRAELAELNDRYVRLLADFDNARRRQMREREESVQYGHQNLVKDLLYSVDNLERAVGHARTSGQNDLEGLLQGIDLVHRELLSALAKHGVTEVEAAGLPFDPGVHEALAQVPDATVPPNTVVQVYQRGYRLRDRLIRPAQVVVSRAVETEGGEAGPG
jgi:molecular chaperone GrpE